MPQSTFLVANVLGEEGANRDPKEPGEGHHNPKLVADGLQGDVVATRRRPARRTRSYEDDRKDCSSARIHIK